ncbi:MULTISPECIES: hypothetical protein [Cyanophyceae]|uniref:hypothetical protein n=1 Tax=Cyanophyceae TaxID=3028117 RepID=UPI0016832497|nr:hypothetical protein [Trichocoleus sp. FACHB-69]MBD1930851.1 hypothetical protein [Trichocoleus sp. FACHB-69]
MQGILTALGQAFRQSILVVGLISLLSLSNIFIFASQPAYAASQLTAQEVDSTSGNSAAIELREESYEEAAEQARDPKKQDEIYQESVKATNQSNPGLIEGAKELVDKVIGNDDSK